MYTKEEITANRAKLIEALRSDKYKQSGYRLATLNNDGNVSYCALGVVCNESGVGDWFTQVNKGAKCDWEYFNASTSVEGCPPSVPRLLGFSTVYKTGEADVTMYDLPGDIAEFYDFTRTGQIDNSEPFREAINKSDSEVATYIKDKIIGFNLEDASISLAELNDDFAMPFPLIADFIEEFGEYFKITPQ